MAGHTNNAAMNEAARLEHERMRKEAESIEIQRLREEIEKWKADYGILADDYKQLQLDNESLRRLLFLRHGCGFNALYGDDGEIQCRECGIDFKWMSAEEISARFEAIGRAKCIADKET